MAEEIDYIKTGIVTGPVDDGALSRLLGAPGTYDYKRLCQHEKVNKWAKYKPFNLSRTFVDDINDSMRKFLRWGFKQPSGFPFWEWEWEMPTEAFRIGDFRSYYHKAEAPFTAHVMDALGTKTRVDDKDGDVDVEYLKGFTGTNNMDDGVAVDVTGTSSTHKSYEYALTDFESGDLYDHCVVAIRPEGGYTQYFQLDKEEGEVALHNTIFHGKIPSRTEGTYEVGISHMRGELTDHVSDGNTLPLLAMRSTFKLNFNEVTVFKDARYDFRARMQIYVNSISPQGVNVTMGNGTVITEEFKCVEVTSLKIPSATITFSDKYARSVYLFLTARVDVIGTDNVMYAPIRIVRSADATKRGLLNCLQNGQWVGSLDKLQASTSTHYDVHGGMSFTISMEAELDKDGVNNKVWICIAKSAISECKLRLTKGITARRGSAESTDCGTLESGDVNEISFNSINSALNWY